MADTKITALAAITTVDPAADVLPIVDISDTSMAASGTTKKITSNQILGSGGTATLASATITGDLTVDTSTLKVDSALNKVGIGVATLTGLQTFNVAGDVGITSDLVLKNSGGTVQGYIFGSSGLNYRVIAGQPHVWQEGGSDLMRLNSTGLGVGASPTTKLDVLGSGDGELRLRAASDAALILSETTANKNWKIKPSGGDLYFQYSATAYNSGYSSLMSLTATGNVGIGVTPSAGGGCLQLKSGITFPATQVASADANTLDDYEEGNWTPTVGDASSGGNQATTATAVGRYTKIGRLVTVQWEVTDINTTGLTAGNALYIRGLPFASSSATTQFGTPAVSGVTFSGYLTAGVFSGSSFPIYSSSSGGSLADIKVSALASGTADIWGTLTYIV